MKTLPAGVPLDFPVSNAWVHRDLPAGCRNTAYQRAAVPGLPVAFPLSQQRRGRVSLQPPGARFSKP